MNNIFKFILLLIPLFAFSDGEPPGFPVNLVWPGVAKSQHQLWAVPSLSGPSDPDKGKACSAAGGAYSGETVFRKPGYPDAFCGSGVCVKGGNGFCLNPAGNGMSCPPLLVEWQDGRCYQVRECAYPKAVNPYTKQCQTGCNSEFDRQNGPFLFSTSAGYAGGCYNGCVLKANLPTGSDRIVKYTANGNFCAGGNNGMEKPPANPDPNAPDKKGVDNDGKCPEGYGRIEYNGKVGCFKTDKIPNDDSACPAGTMMYKGKCTSYSDIINDDSNDSGTSDYCKQYPLAAACQGNGGGGKSSDYCQANPNDPACQGLGGSGKDKPSDDKKEESDYCKQHPEDEKCSNKSEFGGSCEAAFSCKGDAVRCAHALETHRFHCKMLDKNNQFYAQGERGLSGDGGILNSLPGRGEGTQKINLANSMTGAFNTSVISAKSCPAPRRISYKLLGNELEFKFEYTHYCEFADWVGMLVIAIAGIAAMRILSEF